MCWLSHEANPPHELRRTWQTYYDVTPDVGQDEHEQILAELYGLTPAQVHMYDALSKIVDEALEQFDKGYAVCVEEQMADMAKELTP